MSVASSDDISRKRPPPPTEELESLDTDVVSSKRSKLEEGKGILDVASDVSQKVVLNIGGVRYYTTVGTLRSDPGSMFAGMFSGRFVEAKDSGEGKEIPIDRDGTHFRYILNFLRTQKLILPPEPHTRAEIFEEARFYNITGILQPKWRFSCEMIGPSNVLPPSVVLPHFRRHAWKFVLETVSYGTTFQDLDIGDMGISSFHVGVVRDSYASKRAVTMWNQPSEWSFGLCDHKVRGSKHPRLRMFALDKEDTDTLEEREYQDETLMFPKGVDIYVELDPVRGKFAVYLQLEEAAESGFMNFDLSIPPGYFWVPFFATPKHLNLRAESVELEDLDTMKILLSEHV